MLWSTIDPVGTLALFTGLTARLSKAQKTKNSTESHHLCICHFIICADSRSDYFKSNGYSINSLFNSAVVSSFFFFGLQMIFSDSDQGCGSQEPGHQLAVFPLAVPSIASPGAIMAVIVLTDNHVKSFSQQATTAAAMAAVLLVTCCLMLCADRIFRVIGRNGSAIIIRVMGMILAALSVELIMTALGVQRWMS